MKTKLLVLYCNRQELAIGINQDVYPGALELLQKYADIVKEMIIVLASQREFRHVQAGVSSETLTHGDISTPFALVIGTPAFNEDGSLAGMAGPPEHVYDLRGALTATQPLPPVLSDKVGLTEDGALAFVDERAGPKAIDINNRPELRASERFDEVFSPDDDEHLAEALSTLLPEETELAPLHSADALATLSLFLLLGAGPPPSGPNPLSQAGKLLGTALSGAGGLLRGLQKRTGALQRVVWSLEDIVAGGSKAAVRIAKRAARPVLIGLVLHRALRTLDASRHWTMRVAKAPPEQAVDMYYRLLLGDNYQEQFEEDLLEAIKEVNDGYITDDYKQEKRLMTAAMLRQLEVEEWDKERMKHFYYGSYGLGPWYFDMEERLRNPYFVGARAWNGPIEGWVGKNKTYPNDLPIKDDLEVAVENVEAATGKKLDAAARERLRQRFSLSAVDHLQRSGLLEGIDKSKLQDRLTRKNA